MKIKSSKLMKKSKPLSKKYDTIYMDTLDIFCARKAKNVKNIIISKKLLEKRNNCYEIYDTSASNIYFEGFNNFGDLTIPIEYIFNESIHLELFNNNNIFPKFKKINITKDNKILLTLNLEEYISRIEIYEDFDELLILIIYKNKTKEYYINYNGEYEEKLIRYTLKEEDLDNNGDLDIRNFLKYENLFCKKIDINTLIVDKNFFKNLDKVDCLG